MSFSFEMGLLNQELYNIYLYYYVIFYRNVNICIDRSLENKIG
jgi:hypothetical protein